MHNHNHDTHVLVDSQGNCLPTSGSLEEIKAELVYLQSLGLHDLEIRPIDDHLPWHWDLVDWGD